MSKPSFTPWQNWKLREKGNKCQLCQQPIGQRSDCFARSLRDAEGRPTATSEYRHVRCHNAHELRLSRRTQLNPAALGALYRAAKKAVAGIGQTGIATTPDWFVELQQAIKNAETQPVVPAPQRRQRGQRRSERSERIRDALDFADDDLPDGAYFQVAADIAGVDINDVFDELAQ